jgi:hypothetical protein
MHYWSTFLYIIGAHSYTLLLATDEGAVHRIVAIVRELARIVVEGDATDIVEREPLECILEIEGGVGRCGTPQQREEVAV